MLVRHIVDIREPAMNQVYPVRHPPASAASPRGETTAPQDGSASVAVERRGSGEGATPPDAKLPHEHDEASHSQASATASHGAVGGQAYRDAKSAQQDTDKGPEMDRVYNDRLAPDRGDKVPRQ
jgi:hypothetical protein